MRLTLIIATTTLALALVAGCKSSSDTTPPAAPSAQAPTGAAAEPAAEPAGGMQPGGMMAQMRDSCPAMVEGAAVEVSDTDNGVALTFTTSGDVAGLRARARSMGEMYKMDGGHRGMMWHHMGGKMAGAGPPAGGMMGHGMGPGAGMGPDAGMGMGAGMGAGMGMAGGMMPAATATVEDVDGGARVLLVPKDASQLEALRAHARMHCDRMKSGECPMLNPAEK